MNRTRAVVGLTALPLTSGRGKDVILVDVVVNNAGVIRAMPFADADIDDCRESLETYFWGPCISSAPRCARARHTANALAPERTAAVLAAVAGHMLPAAAPGPTPSLPASDLPLGSARLLVSKHTAETCNQPDAQISPRQRDR